jgi:hypothetical protein
MARDRAELELTAVDLPDRVLLFLLGGDLMGGSLDPSGAMNMLSQDSMAAAQSGQMDPLLQRANSFAAMQQ